MTIAVVHPFVSAKADGVDTTLVQPSNWNAGHTITMAAGKVLGRDASGAGAVQELGLSFTAGGDATFGAKLATTDSLTVGSLSGAGFIMLPTGTTAQRPSSTEGRFRYNTDTHRTEYYNGTSWASSSGGGSSVTVSDTPPVSPSDGDLWWSSSDGQLYVYYNDGTSSQWVAAVTGSASGVASQYILITSATNAQASVIYPLDTSGAAFTVTLPAAASVADGYTVTLMDIQGSVSTNNVTISGNGTTISVNGGAYAATATMSANFSVMTFTWQASVSKWRAVSSGGVTSVTAITTGTTTPAGTGNYIYIADVSSGAVNIALTNSPAQVTVVLKQTGSISSTNYVRFTPPSGKTIYNQSADDTVTRTLTFDKWSILKDGSGNYT